MDNILAARSQMAISLAHHIIFAVIGIGKPLLMVIAEWRWRRTKDEVYLTLARRWAKGTAILFAVGAVSGTILSFELKENLQRNLKTVRRKLAGFTNCQSFRTISWKQ